MLAYSEKPRSLLAPCFAVLLLASLCSISSAQEDREAYRLYEEEIASIEADPEPLITLIVDDWAAAVEDMGGSVSQLEATLRTTDAETLLKVSEASSIEEINGILSNH